MNRKKLFASALVAVVGLAAMVASMAIAQSSTDATLAAQSATQPEMKLPDGWTMEDMQACIAAGTPGKEHEQLAKDVGEWTAKCTMWMAPGAEPLTSEGTSTVSTLMDGRYIKAEMKGEMPGMGPYDGFGIYGFDNVSQKLVGTWIDNHSTGIMTGTGELSSDGKTMTWDYTFSCPLTKKPTKLREVHTYTGPNAKTIEVTGADPKTNVEYKMMQMELTKKVSQAASPQAPRR